MQFFRNFIRFSASFREFHIPRVYPSFPEHIISDYRRLSPRFADFTLFYVRLLSISSRTPFMLSSYFRNTPSLVILASTRRSFYFLVPLYFLLEDMRPLLLKHFLFSNSSLFSIKTPCNSTVKKQFIPLYQIQHRYL